MRTQQRFLRVYSGILTCLFVCVLFLGARKREERAKFTEIDVERINIVEKDGRRRLVLSNSALFPAVVSSAGITKERTVRGQGGLLFYDSDGGEAGGLSVRSRSMPNGDFYLSSGLMFDERNEDQALALQYEQQGRTKVAGLRVWDYTPNQPGEATSPVTRVFVGRHGNNDARLLLSDGRGRPRLRLSVSSSGEARIEFLDEEGEVVRQVGAVKDE